MKLRLRYRKQPTVVCTTDDNVNLSQLKNIATETLHITRDNVEVSLNGRDKLEGDEVELSEFGIVSGDLIYINICIPDNHSAGDSDKSPKRKQESESSICQSSKIHKDSKYSCNNMEGHGNEPGCSSNENDVSLKMDKGKVSHLNKETASDTGAEALDHFSDSDVIQATMQLQLARSAEEIREIKEVLCEPLLCRESTNTTVPNTLCEIFKNSHVQSKCEALTSVLHVLMLEIGFFSPNLFASGKKLSLPKDWKAGSPSMYKILYEYPEIEGVTCTLVAVPFSSKLIVHGNVKCDEFQDSVQIQLCVNDWIRSIDPSHGVARVFVNLPKLSRVFKDAIGLPLLNRAHTAVGSAAFQSLSGLSNELKLLLLSYLDVASLVKVSEVSRSFNVLSQDPWLWRRLYLLYWPKREDNSLNQDWLEIYKCEYQKRKSWRERLKKMTSVPPHHPLFPLSPPINGFAPPYSDIIGGNYDFNPIYGFPDPMFPGSGRRIIPDRPPLGFPSHINPMSPDSDFNFHLGSSMSPAVCPRGFSSSSRHTLSRPFTGLRF